MVKTMNISSGASSPAKNLDGGKVKQVKECKNGIIRAKVIQPPQRINSPTQDDGINPVLGIHVFAVVFANGFNDFPDLGIANELAGGFGCRDFLSGFLFCHVLTFPGIDGTFPYAGQDDFPQPSRDSDPCKEGANPIPLQSNCLPVFPHFLGSSGDFRHT